MHKIFLEIFLYKSLIISVLLVWVCKTKRKLIFIIASNSLFPTEQQLKVLFPFDGYPRPYTCVATIDTFEVLNLEEVVGVLCHWAKLAFRCTVDVPLINKNFDELRLL